MRRVAGATPVRSARSPMLREAPALPEVAELPGASVRRTGTEVDVVFTSVMLYLHSLLRNLWKGGGW
ncbi:hypothetical protein GCM10009812_32650 [Nocardioides marinus]